MHKQCIFIGLFHQLSIYLIAAQLVMAAFTFGLAVMHGNPGVSYDQISADHSFCRIGFQRNTHALVSRPTDKLGFRCQCFRPRDRQVKTKLARGM